MSQVIRRYEHLGYVSNGFNVVFLIANISQVTIEATEGHVGRQEYKALSPYSATNHQSKLNDGQGNYPMDDLWGRAMID